MKNKNRILEYDVARVFAILCVVLCHATEEVYSTNFVKEGWLSIQSRIFMIISFTIGRLGVPIFLFLTGALIFKKKINTDKDVTNFYKKNLLPLVIVNSVWVIIYNIYFWLIGESDFITLEIIFKELFLLKQVPLANMWYLPMIIGMYIGLPFVVKIVKVFSKKTLLLLMWLVFISSFVLPMVNVFFRIFNIDNSYSSLLNLNFLGGYYGLYILLGYYMTNKDKIKVNKIKLSLISIVSFTVTCVIQYFSYTDMSNYVYNVWYNFPFLLVCTVCLFLIIISIDYSKLNKTVIKLLNFVSKASLSIFFIHIVIQQLLYGYIRLLCLKLPLNVFILFVSSSIISIGISFILSKNKFISKYVSLIKD